MIRFESSPPVCRKPPGRLGSVRAFGSRFASSQVPDAILSEPLCKPGRRNRELRFPPVAAPAEPPLLSGAHQIDRIVSTISQISYGPCQTPTLGFTVARHMAILQHRPQPFWTIAAEAFTAGMRVRLSWDRGRCFDEAACKLFRVRPCSCSFVRWWSPPRITVVSPTRSVLTPRCPRRT